MILYNYAPAVVKKSTSFNPAIDIAETESAYEISVYAPGFSKDAFTINVEENQLKIDGERPWEEKDGKKFHQVQSGYGKFKRYWQLPKGTDEASVEARYADGILRVTIAKTEKKQFNIAVN